MIGVVWVGVPGKGVADMRENRGEANQSNGAIICFRGGSEYPQEE